MERWFRAIFNKLRIGSFHPDDECKVGEYSQLSTKSLMSPYFINFDPSPTKLRMFFGRGQEIETITNYLRKGDSVFLIGERRIGKTFFLHMFGDHTKKGGQFYSSLFDQDTGKMLAKFHQSTTSWLWVYIDMLIISSPAGFFFNVLNGLGGENNPIIGNKNEIITLEQTAFAEKIKKLSDHYSKNNQRAIVLVDEFEKILTFENKGEVISCLKSVIQQCDAIDFILAGNIKQENESLDLLNLISTMQLIYLGSLTLNEARAFIQVTMGDCAIFDEQTLDRINELTGGKPCLLQILCDGIFNSVYSRETKESNITLDLFNKFWESDLRQRVFDKFGYALRDFYDGLQVDNRNVLCYLAHHPLSSLNDLTIALGLSKEIINSCLQKLLIAKKIKKIGDGYRIDSLIFENYGSQFIVCPSYMQPHNLVNTLSIEDMLNGERDIIEYKASIRWDTNLSRVNTDLEKVITKVVASFLNSLGGIIIVGVADDQTILGIDDDLKTLHKKNCDGYQLRLQEILSDSIGGEYSHYFNNITFEEIQGKIICIIRVQPSPKPVFIMDQGKKSFYIRAGNMCQPLDVEETNAYIKLHWTILL